MLLASRIDPSAMSIAASPRCTLRTPDELVLVSGQPGRSQVPGQEGVHALDAQRGLRIESGQSSEAAGGITDLFLQLAQRGVFGQFPRLNLPRWGFKQELFSGLRN